MAKDQIIVSLDIGSSKIACIVAVIDEGKISVIGAHTHESSGIKNGVVNNIDKAVSNISEALKQTEMMSGHPISHVTASISGTHIESLNSHGVVAISGQDSEISAEDIARVNEAARAISLPSSREIIHVVPREYIVDKQKNINDPTGMTGVRLEVEANIVHGSSTAIKNLTKCIQQVGVSVDQLVYSGLASAEGVLTDTEKELGTILIDIGGGTIDLNIYSKGSSVYSAVLPIGGQDITNDLAIGLRTLMDDAEKVKLKLSKNDELSKKGVVFDKSGKESKIPKGEIYVGDLHIGIDTIPKKLIEEIIYRRLEESFKFVQIYIRRAGYEKSLPAGVVLTGGAAQTKGIEKIAKEVFKLPVRIGKPNGVTGLVDQIQGPAYSSSIGMLKFMSKAIQDEPRLYGRRGNVVSNVSARIISFLKSFLP